MKRFALLFYSGFGALAVMTDGGEHANKAEAALCFGLLRRTQCILVCYGVVSGPSNTVKFEAVLLMATGTSTDLSPSSTVWKLPVPFLLVVNVPIASHEVGLPRFSQTV